MLEAGFIEEVRHLVTLYGPSIPCLQSVGYRQVVDFLSGEGSVDELAEAIDRATWQLVRKQRTWFRRADDIVWMRDAQESMTVLRKNGYNV
jgi:tRNA dimethylallyltransferase